jgi:hypothetical protein
VAEAVDGVGAEDDWEMQARMVDRVVLDPVVLPRPRRAGIAGRVVGRARQDRAGVVVDQHLVEAGRLERVVIAAAAVAVRRRARTAQLLVHDLVHLADLLRQRHPVEQVADPCLDRRPRIEVDRLRRLRRAPRRRPHTDDRDHHDDDGRCTSSRHPILLSRALAALRREGAIILARAACGRRGHVMTRHGNQS